MDEGQVDYGAYGLRVLAHTDGVGQFKFLAAP